jgi:hypothetical protein
MTIPIIRTQHGAFCPACQSLLSIEEEDFETCDACGGDGIGADNDDAPADDTDWQAGGLK